MQQTQSRTQVGTSTVPGIIALVIGIALAIIGQFFLDSLADSSATWHQIQHGVLFVAGLIAGGGVMMLYSVARSRS